MDITWEVRHYRQWVEYPKPPANIALTLSTYFPYPITYGDGLLVKNVSHDDGPYTVRNLHDATLITHQRRAKRAADLHWLHACSSSPKKTITVLQSSASGRVGRGITSTPKAIYRHPWEVRHYMQGVESPNLRQIQL